MISPVIFDPAIMSKKVNKSAKDKILASANNYYGDGVTQNEVIDFYNKMKNPNEQHPIP